MFDPDVTLLYDNDAANGAESYLELSQTISCVGSPAPVATATTTAATPSATATSAPGATATSAAATPSVTPTAVAPTPAATPGLEICDDCIDNDENGDVDRADAAAPRPPRPRCRGWRSLRRRQSALRLPAGVRQSRHASRDGPLEGAQALREVGLRVRPGDADGHVLRGCERRLRDPALQAHRRPCEGRHRDRRALRRALVRHPIADAIGLGFDAEAAACAAAGVASVDDVAAIAACVASRHECRVDRLLGDAVPRARQLLALIGRNPDLDAPCLPTTTGTGTLGDTALAPCFERSPTRHPAPDGACEGPPALRRRGGTLHPRRPDDPDCLPKAHAACTRQRADLDDPTSGAQAKFAAATAKRCAGVPMSTLLDGAGLALGERAASCSALGVGTLDSTDRLADCLGRLNACRADQVVEARTPRLQELLRLGE